MKAAVQAKIFAAAFYLHLASIQNQICLWATIFSFPFDFQRYVYDVAETQAFKFAINKRIAECNYEL